MNRSSYILHSNPAKSTQQYDFHELFSSLSDAGFSPRRVGREIKFQWDGEVYAINPQKGVWVGSTGAGTIVSLLYRLKIHNSIIPITPQKDEGRHAKEIQRRVAEKLRDSKLIAEIDEKSPGSDRIAKKVVSDYHESRGLSIDLLPEDALVRKDKGGYYELIIPLSTDENALSVHITTLDSNGKHGLLWFGGDCRYSLGPVSGEFSVIDGAAERLKINENPDVDWIAIGEGLETAMSIRLLTGWPTIFAVSAGNLEPVTMKILKNMRQEGKGLALVVDRDVSGTGQKAAAKVARMAEDAGISVLFLLPPSIIKGNAKGADWNDAVRELGKNGASGALTIAISRSDEELSKIEVGKVLSLESVRDCHSDSDSKIQINKVNVEETAWEVRATIKEHLASTENLPVLVGISPGAGKSHALADLSRDHLCKGDPVVIVTPTKGLAEEAAINSDALFREGRSDDAKRAGHCVIFPEVAPFSEKMRSIVAHKCSACIFGAAAMTVSRGESPSDQPCSYFFHTIEARQAPVLTTTSAMLEGDPHIGTVKIGKTVQKAKIVLDDTSEISDHRSIHGGNIAEWIRSAHYSIRHDLARIASGDVKDGDENRKNRVEATEKLIPHLEALARLLTSHPGEEQIKVDPEPWAEFSDLVRSSELRWMDGTSAEAVYRDGEGKTEIPMRTLKALGEALSRGTVWVRKSILHFAVPTKALEHIQNGALVLDATPPLAVREIVKVKGGEVKEMWSTQDSLKVRLIPSGVHGKMACSPESPSFAREKKHFLAAVGKLAEEVGPENVAVLSHLSFFSELQDELTELGVEFGHWGLDDRGHNRWETKKALLIWGVQQLSPSVAERQYMSDRQAVLESGGQAWPEWSGTREEKWYRIPGTDKEIHSEGYKNDFVDQWNREWVTARLVQAIGRLRATRRTEPLQVIVHASFPFSQSFGLGFTSVEKMDWRGLSDYHAERKNAQVEKGIVALAALGEDAGRRKVNAWLKKKGMPGIKPKDWAEIKKMVGGSLCEYSLFESGTNPDLFGRDVRFLIEAFDRLEDFADEEGMTIYDMFWLSIHDMDPIEAVALFIIIASFEEERRLPALVPPA